MEKLNTLSQKLSKKLQDLSDTKEDLTEELVKAIQTHSEAVEMRQEFTKNAIFKESIR